MVERIGCYSVESEVISLHQDYSLEIVKACSSVAWSRGLKSFAVRNGSECLSDENLPFVLPRLNASKGCSGGRGGRKVADVYHLTSKKAFSLCDIGNILTISFLYINKPVQFFITRMSNHASAHSSVCPSSWPPILSLVPPYVDPFFQPSKCSSVSHFIVG